MELSEKEFTTIQKSRTKARTNALVKRYKTEKAKRSAILSAKKSVEDHIKECKERLEREQDFFNKLREVGAFTFSTETVNHTETPSISVGGGFKDLTPLKYSIKRSSIFYIAHDLEDVSYKIVVSEHITQGGGWSSMRRSKGFKMEIQGLVYCPHTRSDYGKRISKPEKVMEIIQEDINTRKRRIQAELDEASLKERALAELTEKYADAEIKESYVRRYRSNVDTYEVKFKNGVVVNLSYEDYDDETNIVYTVMDIDSDTLEGLDFTNLLSKI